MILTFADDPDGISGDLPNFGAPPVVEVTCGIQFEELAGYNSLMLAEYRKIVEDQFPIVEEHPALPPVFETFGKSENQITQPKFEIVTAPVPTRFFLVNNEGKELLQIQKDRFHYNWRKTTDPSSYPRYDAIKKPFRSSLIKFESWLKEKGLGEIQPTQSEVVYVNRIPLTVDGAAPCGLSDIFDWFGGLEGITENGSFKFKRRLVDQEEESKPIGRFYFELDYGTGPEGEREAFLKLTVRGRPISSDMASHLEFIDQGRAIIVQQFAGVTSEASHKYWKMQ